VQGGGGLAVAYSMRRPQQECREKSLAPQLHSSGGLRAKCGNRVKEEWDEACCGDNNGTSGTGNAANSIFSTGTDLANSSKRSSRRRAIAMELSRPETHEHTNTEYSR